MVVGDGRKYLTCLITLKVVTRKTMMCKMMVVMPMIIITILNFTIPYDGSNG